MTLLTYRNGSDPTHGATTRPSVRGKFVYVGSEKFHVRGVTYGTFRPDSHGAEFHDPAQVEQDFAAMHVHGFNAVRTYTVPPRWLLDTAAKYNLFVMVGLPWEQHVAFLDIPDRANDIERRVRTAVRECAGHPAVLFYAIGNEMPSSIVRWYGPRKVEKFLKRLYEVVKEEDPGSLVTYVNYPSTEYLELPFLDLVCFNVYLEAQDRLEAYLARLHNLAGDKPLVMAEIGLDSRSHGTAAQATVLDWQIRTVFRAGCTGLFVFSWTDEWYRGGQDIDGWDFGLTDRSRNSKPALLAVQQVFADVPFASTIDWPRISVIVCSYNGSRTIGDTCEGLRQLDYPDFEVIVVDDGSSDATGVLAREFGFRVITTENRGLSSARNTGFAAATGSIIAYTDDDARPDPQWLRYLALEFMNLRHAAVGGPNIAPPEDGLIAACVANAPGGPVHVLLSDREAEHVPGCNLAIRASAMHTLGGFDTRFRVAGDDLDICWRILEHGWSIGFSPAAVVWHHRRNSLRTYWKQQRGYGKAEALLEHKWPEKYNGAGHVSWGGQLYGKGLTLPLPWRSARIYHGRAGSALFQSIYQPVPGSLGSLSLMPEWHLLILAMAYVSALGLIWTPLLLAVPVFIFGMLTSILQAARGGARATFFVPIQSSRIELQLRSLTAFLHLTQPVVRLWGRVHHGLTPWRRRGYRSFKLLHPRSFTVWRKHARSPAGWLDAMQRALRARGAVVFHGGDFDT